MTAEIPAYAALLSAQGKTMFDMLVWPDGADLLLDCEAELAGDLAKRLSLYRLQKAVGSSLARKPDLQSPKASQPN